MRSASFNQGLLFQSRLLFQARALADDVHARLKEPVEIENQYW